MSWRNKVVWSEGMFLRPQHFQQHDRYLELLVEQRCSGLRPHGWGVRELAVDGEALALGRFALTRCSGVMPDGTPFNLPEDDQSPAPLNLDTDIRDQVLMLTIPLRRMGMNEVEQQPGASPDSRFTVSEIEVKDYNSGFETSVPVQIGHRRLELKVAAGDLSELAALPVARVVEVDSQGRVRLDEEFMPTCLGCWPEHPLGVFLTELVGLLRQRGEALAGRVRAEGSGAAEIADFLMLQLVNRCEPLFTHLESGVHAHPEDLYRSLLQLAGELATFTSDSKRPQAFPTYQHEFLNTTFEPLILALRQSLSMVLEQNAIQLPLQERRYGIHVAAISDRSLIGSASFVLAVTADLPADTVRQRFPTQVKIGPVEQIRELVNLQLPGIALRALPVAPRQIPYHAGATYFELGQSGEHWKQLASSGGFAFHVGGKFPGMVMEFWAIRGAR
jgi:type VI secretion system protein ImpJ